MPDFSVFAPDDADAAARAARWVSVDPFPSVPCSLLSSAEIRDYARVTGMLFPFDSDSLKSASYEVHIGGEVIRWDEKGKRCDRIIKRGDRLILPPNSITFVQVAPVFRLPNYLAIRFNLRITHVHRGLLLGTGPLVDPGFEGKLLVPLHNLTASQYDLDTNDALIWVEFTKTTFDFWPKEPMAAKPRAFKGFPETKKNLTPDYYLRKANGGNPIRSSIPDALEQGRASARNAEQTVKIIRNWIAGLGIIAVLAFVAALVAVYLQVGSMVQNSIALSTAVDQELASLKGEAKQLAEDSSKTEDEVAKLRSRVDQLSTDLSKLSAERTEFVAPKRK